MRTALKHDNPGTKGTGQERPEDLWLDDEEIVNEISSPDDEEYSEQSDLWPDEDALSGDSWLDDDVPPKAALPEGRLPEDLWMDDTVTPEELIELDPLDITATMLRHAQQPELTDRNLQSVRCPFSEKLWWKIIHPTLVRELRRKHEAEAAARLAAAGSSC